MGKYNLTEKKEKNAAYRSLVRAELVDELYEKILKVFVVDKKYRGSLARCIPAYTHDLHDDLLRARPERVFITHSGCDPEVVEQVRTYLTSLNYFDAVIETRAGGVISCHCGPGTLGVLFILKE